MSGSVADAPFTRLSISDLHVLAAVCHLDRRGESPTTSSIREELRPEMSLSEGSISNCLRKLEDNGLVDRCRDPDDGRRFVSDPTAEGRRLLEHYLLDLSQRLGVDVDLETGVEVDVDPTSKEVADAN